MKIEYQDIVCPVCGCGQYEFLKENRRTYVQFNGIETAWEFDNRIVICNKCGHVYLNPSPTEEVLADYYSSSMTLYDDASSFSIDNRIDFLLAAWDIVHPDKNYVGGKKSYCEIGSNECKGYKKALENYFDYITCIDIDENADVDLNHVNSLDTKADVIAMYYVMEHVGNIADMLKKCYANLKEGGILVIEVPDIELYINNASSLEVLEHVNHFSPMSLMNVCGRNGFKLVHFSRDMASRSYGFVAAFIKGEMSLEESIMLVNKASVQEAWNKLERVRPANIQKLVQGFCMNETALWCANDMCKEFLSEYESKVGKYIGLIVDEDPRKCNFLDGKIVYTSTQAMEKIKKYKRIIIFFDVRKQVIFERIKELVDEMVRVEYIDDWFEVHKLQ